VVQFDGHLRISVSLPTRAELLYQLGFGNWPTSSKSDKINFLIRYLKGSSEVMAQQCEICGKKPQSGNRISHAHNVTKRRWNVNLRPVHARVGATTRRMRVCASCLRSGKVVKA
jgi:large subunit ribosomal protein L28